LPELFVGHCFWVFLCSSLGVKMNAPDRLVLCTFRPSLFSVRSGSRNGPLERCGGPGRNDARVCRIHEAKTFARDGRRLPSSGLERVPSSGEIGLQKCSCPSTQSRHYKRTRRFPFSRFRLFDFSTFRLSTFDTALSSLPQSCKLRHRNQSHPKCRSPTPGTPTRSTGAYFRLPGH
jgi:hypothetical protein